MVHGRPWRPWISICRLIQELLYTRMLCYTYRIRWLIGHARPNSAVHTVDAAKCVAGEKDYCQLRLVVIWSSASFDGACQPSLICLRATYVVRRTYAFVLYSPLGAQCRRPHDKNTSTILLVALRRLLPPV